MNKAIRIGTLAALATLVLIQLVPYGRDHSNPPVANEPPWDSPETRRLFLATCGDCHSHETRWPWYSSIAPASWLMQYDVEEGRSELNVSRWGEGKQEGDEAAGMVREGEMPPWFYLPLHPEARLAPDQEQRLIAGLVATFGDEAEHEH
jgi:mono/diheme cytochrome c family protein